MKPEPQRPERLKLELAADVLRSFGELRLVAHGASMIPAILPGDILLVRHQALAMSRPGDVALWRRDGRFYAHRVLRLENTCEQSAIVTCGDTLREEDSSVTGAEFLGHVYAIMRRGKRIELARHRGVLLRGIALLARHSDFLTRWLLRYNSLRCAIAERIRPAAQNNPKRPELLECP